MVAYSFKSQFIAPIRSRVKRQTIRADRKRHARSGEALQLYSGLRTRHCLLIGRAVCRSVQPIRIEVDNAVIGFQSGLTLTTIGELDDFAISDGFPDWGAMREFWEANHPATPIFAGVLILWTDLISAAE